jgi:hypothetical protein
MKSLTALYLIGIPFEKVLRFPLSLKQHLLPPTIGA